MNMTCTAQLSDGNRSTEPGLAIGARANFLSLSIPLLYGADQVLHVSKENLHQLHHSPSRMKLFLPAPCKSRLLFLPTAIRSTAIYESIRLCMYVCILFSSMRLVFLLTLSRSPLALIYFHFHWSIEFDRGKASRSNRVTKIPRLLPPRFSLSRKRGRRQPNKLSQPVVVVTIDNPEVTNHQPNGYLLCTSEYLYLLYYCLSIVDKLSMMMDQEKRSSFFPFNFI